MAVAREIYLTKGLSDISFMGRGKWFGTFHPFTSTGDVQLWAKVVDALFTISYTVHNTQFTITQFTITQFTITLKETSSSI